MESLYLLIPLSMLAMLGVLAVFAWALHGGQFDDLEDEAARILQPDPLPQADEARAVVVPDAPAPLDAGQAAAALP